MITAETIIATLKEQLSAKLHGCRIAVHAFDDESFVMVSVTKGNASISRMVLVADVVSAADPIGVIEYHVDEMVSGIEAEAEA